MKYDATKHSDLARLVEKLENIISIGIKFEIVTFLLFHGMMKPSGVIPRLVLWGIRKFNRYDVMKHFVLEIVKKEPNFINSFFIDLKRHILYGDDMEDKNSVGGFSQREINLLVDNFRIFL